MRKTTTLAFTLVELIVVITILAILGTIGFVSLQGYSVNARDSVRIADTKTYIKALNIYQTKNGEVPLPDDMTTITGSGVVFSYQGTLSGSVIAELGQGQIPLDPLLGTPYLYAMNEGRTKVQLLSYHEKNISSLELQNTLTQAETSYTDMFPKVMGDEIGILLNSDSSPLGGGSLVLSELEDNYNYILSSDFTVSGSGSVLVRSNPRANCKRVRDTGMSYGNGNYTILPAGGDAITVYCDMESDGGGWTLAVRALAGSYAHNTESSLGELISPTQESVAKLSHDLIREIGGSASYVTRFSFDGFSDSRFFQWNNDHVGEFQTIVPIEGEAGVYQTRQIETGKMTGNWTNDIVPYNMYCSSGKGPFILYGGTVNQCNTLWAYGNSTQCHSGFGLKASCAHPWFGVQEENVWHRSGTMWIR